MPHSHKGITLATRITILRMLGIPVFILFLIYYRMELESGVGGEIYRWLALAMFVGVALTDALDGYLARSRHEVTRLGTILDPLADKALMLSAVIMLTYPFPPDAIRGFPVWFALIVISRDVILIGGALLIHFHSGHVDVKPRWSGKMATFFTMFTIVVALAKAPPQLQGGLVGITTCFVLVSGLQYTVDGVRQFEHEHQHGGGRHV